MVLRVLRLNMSSKSSRVCSLSTTTQLGREEEEGRREGGERVSESNP